MNPKEKALDWFRKELNLSIGMSDTRFIEKALNIAISETRKQTAKEIFEKLESMASFTGLQKMFFHNEKEKFLEEEK